MRTTIIVGACLVLGCTNAATEQKPLPMGGTSTQVEQPPIPEYSPIDDSVELNSPKTSHPVTPEKTAAEQRIDIVANSPIVFLANTLAEKQRVMLPLSASKNDLGEFIIYAASTSCAKGINSKTPTIIWRPNSEVELRAPKVNELLFIAGSMPNGTDIKPHAIGYLDVTKQSVSFSGVTMLVSEFKNLPPCFYNATKP